MATIGTASHSSYLNTPRISYITTTAFQNDIFRYTTSLNPTTFQTTGTLTSLATAGTATAANCPANRILRENGKKLYPSGMIVANDLTYGAPNPGVTTYMVGVYDPISFLSGFIDPNSKVFAPYNQDKPEYVARGINPNGNTEVDQGPPVYTLGTVTAGAAVFAGTAIGYGGAAYTGPTAVTQGSGSGKGTAVTANGPVVDITLDGAALNRDTTISFALTNSSITANDTLVINHIATGTFGAYLFNARVTAAGAASITLRNVLPGTDLSEAIVLRIFVLHS
jgi:hypothetical protein